MTTNELPKPTEAELDILSVLWDLGPATVRQVHEKIEQTKPSQYTTTLKLLQIMAAKGLVERDESERSHVYTPAVRREQLQQQMTVQLMDRLFGGSMRGLLMGALSSKRVSKNELAELRQMIEDYEKRRK